MPLTPLLMAVNNNALWCNTVCKSHGNPGEFLEDIWINRHTSPPFYPNAVTLQNGDKTDVQNREIMQLMDSNLPEEWAVKDSFAALDLSDLGFSILFQAEWIHLDSQKSFASSPNSKISIDIIQDGNELLAWEAAWYGSTDGDRRRIFLPSLLHYQNTAIISAKQNETIVAGVIASENSGVVGISNLFYPESGGLENCTACLEKVFEAFPGLPLVGYESGEELDIMQKLGFKSIGNLRVWLRNMV